MPRKRKEEVTIEPGKGLNLDPELIKQLVPGTLDRATINEQLAALKKAIFGRALGGELTHHLGYEKGDAKPSDEAALKLIWLALRNVVAKWTGSRHDWKSAMTQFALLYPERFSIGI